MKRQTTLQIAATKIYNTKVDGVCSIEIEMWPTWQIRWVAGAVAISQRFILSCHHHGVATVVHPCNPFAIVIVHLFFTHANLCSDLIGQPNLSG